MKHNDYAAAAAVQFSGLKPNKDVSTKKKTTEFKKNKTRQNQEGGHDDFFFSSMKIEIQPNTRTTNI